MKRCQHCGASEPLNVTGTICLRCAFDLGPVAEVAREIEQAEQTAPPLADLPFALEAPISGRRAKQGGLF